MVERILFSGLAVLMAAIWTPDSSTAQTTTQFTSQVNANETMPRLTLPIARENYPVDSFIANEEGHVVLIATIGVDGQMSNARLEASSGHVSLDEASIALANDARLPTPPTNAAGDPVRTDVIVDVIWELPEPVAVARNDSPETNPDGLLQDLSSEFAVAFFRPGADFSGYDKLIIEGPEIAFRDGWRRQHSRATLNDMERIRRERAEWFREVFIAEFTDDGAYQLVDEMGQDVLTVRAGIGELDVVAPFLSSETEPGYSLTAGGTAATLVLELIDSTTGEVLARLFDRRQEASSNFDTRATRYGNERDARGIFGDWAELLRARLDEDHNI